MVVRALDVQVYTQRGFIAKLFLAHSDMANLEELDSNLTKCLLDMQVRCRHVCRRGVGLLPQLCTVATVL